MKKVVVSNKTNNSQAINDTGNLAESDKFSNFTSTNEILVYPNPTNKFVTIDWHNIENCGLAEIRLYNYQGLLLTTNVDCSSGTTQINVSNFETGIYFLQIIIEDNVQQQILRIQR